MENDLSSRRVGDGFAIATGSKAEQMALQLMDDFRSGVTLTTLLEGITDPSAIEQRLAATVHDVMFTDYADLPGVYYHSE